MEGSTYNTAVKEKALEKLDQTYLNQLVVKTQSGSSNAFAELFAAVYERHDRYLSFMIRDEQERKNALVQVYVYILHNIGRLNKPALFLPWSMRICYRQYKEKGGSHDTEQAVITPYGTYSLSQLSNLPLTESEILIMHDTQGISVKEIGMLLNIDSGIVRRSIKSAVRHLQKGQTEKQEVSRHESIRGKHAAYRRPDALEAADILEKVFELCGKEPNTVPLEALSSYAVYRKERFSLQRGVLVAAMILFLLLPFLFILPEYEVSAADTGERGLPVYTIRVRSILPVGKVIAKMREHSLPVYEADAYVYSVEPIRNGTMKVEVELINKQGVTAEYEVTEVDAKSPQLTDSQVLADTVVLKIMDEGIGVDYREIYAVNSSGKTYYPLSIDENTGEVVFAYPEENWDVYIPDHIGNTLHLTFTFV